MFAQVHCGEADGPWELKTVKKITSANIYDK